MADLPVSEPPRPPCFLPKLLKCAAKSRFFANISHELRTPLTLMLGPVKSLLKGNHSPEQQEKLLTMAKQSGQQLQQLINEILNLQKLEMGKMEVHTEPTLLSAFFNRYTARFESLAQSRHIDFRHETTMSDDAVSFFRKWLAIAFSTRPCFGYL